MFNKLFIFLLLSTASFDVLACGGSSSSIFEDLVVIISLGLLFSCFFILPLSVVLFNTSNRWHYIACFAGYFFCATAILITMLYADNDMSLFLSIPLCLFCALPTFHTLYLAYTAKPRT